MARSGVRGEREGRAEPATSVSRATRDQSDPRSDRPARAAWAVQRLLAALVRSTAAPSRLVNLVGGDDGARRALPTARSQPHVHNGALALARATRVNLMCAGSPCAREAVAAAADVAISFY